MSKDCILLISCSVGYGHQAAAANVEATLRDQHPGIEIIKLDTRQYFPPGVGKISDQWDALIRKGRFSVSQIVQVQGPYEAFYARFLDWRLSRDLAHLFKTHHITAVYDTQPMFTPIFYKAFSKACAKRTLVYHKILTDLPTPRNASFFCGIQRIEPKDNVTLKIHAPAPLLTPDQTVENFWKTHCHLPAEHIEQTFALPVHPGYSRPPTDLQRPTIQIHHDWQISLPLPSDAYVTTLMLGSQGVDAIYDYATRYLEQIEHASLKQPHYFFIACSKNKALYDSLNNLLNQHPLHKDTAHRLIPLTMQTMDALSSLMWRSNQVIIRSGGISSIEQLALAQARQNHAPKVWIHSGYKGDNPDDLLKHTYAWERGNAEYLIHHLGAKMTAPQLIKFFDGSRDETCLAHS